MAKQYRQAIIQDIQEDLSHKRDPGKIYLRIDMIDAHTGKACNTFVVLNYENYFHWEDIIWEWLHKNPTSEIYETCLLDRLQTFRKRRDIIDGDSKPIVDSWHPTDQKPTLGETLFY